MHISTWLKSFQTRLSGYPRRPNRRSPEHAARTLEFLEARHLLAAPQLIDVQDEGGRVINAGQEIQNSPTTIVLDFDSTPDLDATTISTITLERAGQDGAFDGTDVQVPVTVSIVGSAPNEVVLQLGQTLPSDLYRINLPGTLANTNGETFNGGTDGTFDFSIQLPPPSLVAVRPNIGEFLAPGETRNVAPNELTLQFNAGQILNPLTINTSTVRVERAGHDGTFGDGNEQFVKIGYVGIGDVPEEVVIRFAENLPDDDYRILLDGTSAQPIKSTSGETLNDGDDSEFLFSLDLGARIIAIDPQPVTRDENTGVISQARNQIVLYLNDDDLLPASATNPAFYQLFFTNNTVSNLDDNDLDGNPATGPETINPSSAVYDADADTITLTFPGGSIDQIAGAGTYRLRVGTNESIPVAPTPKDFTATNNADPGDSYDSATRGELGNLSSVKSQVITAAIEPKAYPFQFPGALDEPGHRTIEIETHLNGGPDQQSGTTQIDYNFQSFYGLAPDGQAPANAITEPQRQRAREVFEYYSVLLGIDFRETANSGFTIATGDLRVLDPLVPTGAGGVTGIAGGGVAIMDSAETWDDQAGENWFQTAMHEIGHLLGLGHESDLSPITVNAGDGYGNTNPGAFNGFAEPVFPGDHDLVHGKYLHRPDSNDIDLYRFNVTEEGLFTAEIMAERLASSSQLDSALRLFREDPMTGKRTLIAQNDDYFSEDSYLELTLQVGTYFLGVSSTGNNDYDPAVPGTGFGGTSQGRYEMRVNFRPDVTNPANVLVDETNTPFDGDSDGHAGGVYNFWFRATATNNTLFVDQNAADAATPGRANNGTAASPFLKIKDALAVAQPGQIVRIIGNGGVDGEESVYQVGTDTNNAALRDGATFNVPRGVTVMIDGGAILKLRAAAIGVGSSTTSLQADRSAGALQVLGTPDNQVIFTSWLNENVGGDTTPTPTSAAPGNWGGIIFRNKVDRAEGRFNYQNEGIFLNYVSNAFMEYGGGNVTIDSVSQTVNPIHVTQAQPTIVHNTITRSLDSAISADPDSFEENTFHSPRFQEGDPAFTSDYTRIGPDIHWNTLVDNTTNGLFVRVQTREGAPIEKLTVPGRFNDLDIVHVISQNLEIQGTPGGPLLDATGPDTQLVVTTANLRAAGTLTPGTYNYRMVYVDINGFESPTSAVTGSATITAGVNNAILVSGMPAAPATYAGRRLYRSQSSGTGPYTLVAELGRSEPAFQDNGVTLPRILDTTVTSRNRARFDARLSVDPGVVVKLEGSRIQTGLGAQFIAEGQPGQEIIFTSRLDDRFGAGGTFDTNNDGDLVTPQFVFLEDDFETGSLSAATWNPATTTATVDTQGLGEPSGTQSAHLRPNQILRTQTLNLNSETAVEIQYAFQRTGSGTAPGNIGDLRVEYRDGGGVWRLASLQPGNGADMTSYQSVVVRLPAAALHTNSSFRVFNTSATGDWFVDDFRVVRARTENSPSAGNWGGIYVGHLGSASIDQALITFGGGVIPVGNDFSGFNPIEIHQADARITNTVFENNAAGTGGTGPADRLGLFSNSTGTIFVRGAQPIIVDNIFRDNNGPVISINANALNSDLVRDPGRSTGRANRNVSVVGNQGPLVTGNLLGGNSINGMVVRPATLTTQGVWDDTDIVHVLENEILIPDFHTYGGLRLESSSVASLVVKLQGTNAGFTANGYPIDIDDRIGGSLQIIGQPGQPVILTSLSDDSVGAGFDLLGLPLRDTNNDGFSQGSPGQWRSVRIAEYAHDANIETITETEPADPLSADVNNTIGNAQVIGLLASDRKSGDENLRLGFEVHGTIDSNNDQDIYSFEAEAGTQVWIDIDRTSVGLDTVVELLDSSGNILAQSDNTLDEENGVYDLYSAAGIQVATLDYSPFFDRDLYTLNPADAGMRVTLHGAVGLRQFYFVRVRSSNLDTSSTPTVLLSDNFEGTLSPANWVLTGDPLIDPDTSGLGIAEPSGVRSLNLNNDVTSVPPATSANVLTSVPIDLSAAPGATVTYSFQRTGGGNAPGVGEDLVLEYRNTGGSWVELERQLGAGADMGAFQRSIVTLPAAARHSTFAMRLRILNPTGQGIGDWFVDDVQVASLPLVNRSSLQSNSSLNDGRTSGVYQLQVRLRDVDEVPGSQITNADIRYATTGVEVLGQPIHSLITGEAAENSGVTVLPNVLNTDRAAISISGRLVNQTGVEVDLYQFEVAYDVTQTIAGDGDDTAHVPVIFDLDYADGFSRANTSIAIFNDQNELILVGRDSNISDDQGKPLNYPGESSADVDDTSRGSNGKKDPFIGPVELISGTYTMAVYSNERLPAVLSQFFTDQSSSLVRVEPINSVQRVAEERFDSSLIVIDPVTGQLTSQEIFSDSTANRAITDLFTVNGSQLDPKHVVPFNLGDVSLFVSVDGGTKSGDRTALYTVDPFTGTRETTVGGFGNIVGDIAMRADGQLHAFTLFPGNVDFNPNNLSDGNVGNYLRIDTGTAEASNVGDDGVTTTLQNANASPSHDVGTQYRAMTYSGSSNGNNLADLWAVGQRTTLSKKTNQAGIVNAAFTSNILYNLNIASGNVDGDGNDRRTDTGFTAQSGAGTVQREHGYIDTTAGNNGLGGIVTGMVTLDGGFTFYVVDDAGGLYLVEPNSSGPATTDPRSPDPNTTFSPGIRTTFLRNIGANEFGIGALNLNFQGLALGPENVENGLLSQTLFGITRTGEMYAFDTTGDLQPVFVNGRTSVDTGLNSVNGVAFGTLDYNLWHVTSRRGGVAAADDGHGIDVAPFDNSVVLPEPGGNSLHFGFEDGGNTPDPSYRGRQDSGNKNTNLGNNQILNATQNTIDFPGGAHGTVVSNEFSLEGYSSADKPALYFNYFLDTENVNFDDGPNPDELMRDALRVFVQDESGHWNLLVTNNSWQETLKRDEFDIGPGQTISDGINNYPSAQSFPDVVEAFDDSGWRQAKVDLSNYAGLSGLKLRFDFSTAGAMDLGNILTAGSELYANPGSELTDGDTITLSDYDANGNQIGQTTFEFDLGAHLTLPSGNAAIGQTFRVQGPGYDEIFLFTPNADPLNTNEILALPTDSAAELARRTSAHLDGVLGGFRLSMAAGGSLQDESFRFGGQIFTYTSNPLLPSDILAEFGDTPATMAVRTANKVNQILGGVDYAFVNGNQVDLFRGSEPVFGGSLNISGGSLLNNESFTVKGTTFTFTTNAQLATDIDLYATPGNPGSGFATNAQLTLRARDAINAEFGQDIFGFDTAFVDNNAPTRLSVPYLETDADGFYTGGTLNLADVSNATTFELETFTVFGQTFTFLATPDPARPNDIEADPGDSAAVVAARVRAKLDGLFGAGTVLPVDPAVPERVSIPRILGTQNALTRGSVLVINNVADLEKYEFQVSGQVYRFTALPDPTYSGDILARAGDSPVAVATDTVRVINNNSFGINAFQDGNRVHLPNLSNASSGIFRNSTMSFLNATPQNIEGDSFTVYGTTYTWTTNPFSSFQLPPNAVDISYNSTFTAADFAAAAVSAVNAKLAASGLSARASVSTPTTTELVGIDFGPGGDVSPTNWTSTTGNGGANFTLSNLVDEAGAATPFDLSVQFVQGTGSAVANTPVVGNLPTHSNSLDNVDGALTAVGGSGGQNSIYLTFEDLSPSATYEIYLLGGDTSTTSSQQVIAFGSNFQFFNQNWNNNQFVNSQVSSNAALSTFAVNVTASSAGQIEIRVDNFSGDVVIPAVAIREVATPELIDLTGSVSTEIGSTVRVVGDQAAQNADVLQVEFNNFTFLAAPTTTSHIQSDASPTIAAANLVDGLNTYFGQFTFSPPYLPAFRVQTRVSIPGDNLLNYTDAATLGLLVSDYPRLDVNASGSLLGDVLRVSGVDFTFVDSTTPGPTEIGSNGAGNWTDADVAAAINGFFGANTAVVNTFSQVVLRVDPTFGGVLQYTDAAANGGLVIVDDGSSQDPFSFALNAKPSTSQIQADLPGSPLTVDSPGTRFVHDVATSPISLIPPGVSHADGNRVTVRSATSIIPGSAGGPLVASGGAGTDINQTGTIFTLSTDPTILDGDQLLVPDPSGFGGVVSFTYVNGTPFGTRQIQTGINVAANTKTVVDAFFSQNMFNRSGNTLTLATGVGQVTFSDSAADDGGASFAGATARPAISVAANMTAAQVGIAIRQGLADVYSASDINNVKGYEDLVQIIGHDVIDAGPLRAAVALAGDEFGAFNAGFVNGQATRPGSLRGMNNSVEGVFIDDIIIGFAERGEMVTNAPADSSFIKNPDILQSQLGGNGNVSLFNEFGQPNVYADILSGYYDVEIRRASDYGESFTSNPSNILYRTLDTNDREIQGISVTVPGAITIPDRSTFSVSNGINTVTYQFVDERSSTLAADPGNIRILYDPSTGRDGTAQDNQERMARLIVAAINSAASQDALGPNNLTDEFRVQATYSDTSGNTSSKLHLTGNAIFIPDPTLAQQFVVTTFNFTGDQNRERAQGQIIIQNSFVRDSSDYGIVVDAGARGDGLAHPGSVRHTQEVNTLRRAPGVVISNNVIADNVAGGIRYSGDSLTSPNGVTPVGRIVNNTLVGVGTGVGVFVNDGAAPTLLNNIIVNFGIGISATAGSPIVGATLYQNNLTNSNVGLGTFPIQLGPNDPLFVDAANGNYYPAPGSAAIDSSVKSLADNPDIVRVKTPLGGGLSPLLAPELDVYGQVRGDDDAVDTPSAQGGSVFLDRGAIDRVDFAQPIATLSNPEDGASNDLDAAPGRVWAIIPEDLRQFRVRLDDQGIGIDDSRIRTNQFVLRQDNADLIDGVHYVWSYNSVTNDVLFTAVTTFPLERRYTIIVQNQPLDPVDPTSIDGVRDLAGNYLEANQVDGTTVFEILLTDGVNDPPINTVPSGRQQTDEDSVLTFSAANGNAITVNDADVHLAQDASLNVLLTVTDGVLTLASTTGLTFGPDGSGGTWTGSGEATMQFRGTIQDINAALSGLMFTPAAEYSNTLSAAIPSSSPAVLTIQTDDGNLDSPPVGQFADPSSPVETDIDTIQIDIIAVNDPPSFDLPIVNPVAIDEDTSPPPAPNFVTGMSPGPLESAQSVAFVVQAPVITSGNLVFTQDPAISASGALTYAVAPDTNGTATFVFTLVDSNSSDPNHVPASSAPVTVTITVNSVNDEPLLTASTNVVNGTEDINPTSAIPLVASAVAGPATATDEVAAPPAGQSLTFMGSTPVVTAGNLAFASFAVSPTDGSLTYTLVPDTAGSATFNLWVEDSGPTAHLLDDNTSAPVTITINIAAAGDPPVPVTGDYVIDEGDALLLDASASTDPDTIYPGDTLMYSWDLNNDGTFDIVNSTTSIQSVPWATLSALNLNVPGDNPITLQVTDTFEGTSVSTTANLTILTVDYGDAPDSYGTLKASNGPGHTIVSGFHLGASIDSETDGQADDGADEDGIAFEAGMQADSAIDIESFFTANASAAGKLDVWVDFNNNGTFEASEQLNGGNSYDLVAGDNLFNFTIRAGQATTGVDTAVRARFSSAGDLNPTGRADDGEVEDYVIQFSPLLDPVGVQRVLPMFNQTSDSTPLIQWEQLPGTPVGANARYNVELRNAANQVVGFEENHVGESLTISDSLPPGMYTAFITPINRAGETLPPIALTPFEIVSISVATPSGATLDNTPTVTWNGVNVTDHYQLQIRSAVTGQVLINETSLPGDTTSYDVASAMNLGSYQVRVRAVEDTTGQIGDWSAYRTFQITTAPSVTAPVSGSTITSAAPTVTWDAVPGAATYQVRINDITDNVVPLRTVNGLTGTSLVVAPSLKLGQFSVEVRAVDALAVPGAWSTVSTFTVGLAPVVSQPTGRLPDATPTIGWAAVPGANLYNLSVTNTTTGAVVYSRADLTGTQHTVPDASALPLGLYNVRVTARNLPSNGSTSSEVSAVSVASAFVVTAPPEILAPNVGIYDGTPDVTWTLPPGAQLSELQITNAVTGATVYTNNNIAGDTVTVTGLDGLPLPPGEYRARVRSFTDATRAVASDWSTFHVFQIGSAPVPLGPAEGLGSAPFYETVLARPTLTWQQSLAGETFEVWLSDVTNQTVVRVQAGIEEASYTVPQDLPVGRYRYFVRADNGLGEKSAWSSGYAFDVKTRPVIEAIPPSFEKRPTFQWNAGGLQPEIDVFQVYLRRLDVSPVQDTVTEFTISGNSFTPTEDLPRGQYRIWVRGQVNAVPGSPGTVRTAWSVGQDFEIGGRPRVNSPGATNDSTPLISWTAVGQASSYQLWVALASTPGNPVVNVSGLTSTFFEVTDPLPNGDYVAWVRATSTSGEVSLWSALNPGKFSVSGSTSTTVGRVVVDPVPNSTDSTPTFSWSQELGAQRYDLYVSTADNINVALIREQRLTTTTFTSARTLAPGSYRVWVRAISAEGTIGAWSVPVNFQVLLADDSQRDSESENNLTMLTSLSTGSDVLQADDVTVSLIPAFVVEDRGRQTTSTQISFADETSTLRQVIVPQQQSSQVSETDEPVAETVIGDAEADTMMADWDAAIWEAESAALDAGEIPDVAVVEAPVKNTGWLAGLAMVSTSLLRRGRRRKSQE